MDQEQEYLNGSFDFVDKELCSKLLQEFYSKKEEKTLNWSVIKLASCDDQVFTVQTIYWKIVCPQLVAPEFSENPFEDQVLFIKVHSCTGDVLTQIVKYIYTGEMSMRISMKVLSMISNTADLLGLKFLSLKCNEFLKNSIKPSNWNEMLKFSIESNDNQIIDKILEFVKTNIPKFYETEQFYQLSFDEVKRILSWPKGLFELNKKAMEVFIKWNHCSGTILPVEKFRELYELADKYKFGQNESQYKVKNEVVVDQKPEIGFANTTNTNPAINASNTNTNIPNSSKPTTKTGPGRPRKSHKRDRTENFSDDEYEKENGIVSSSKVAKVENRKPYKIKVGKRPKKEAGTGILSSSQIIFYRKEMKKPEIISFDINSKSCRTYLDPNEPKNSTNFGSTLVTGNDRVYKIGGFLSKNKVKISKTIQSFSIPQFMKLENDTRISWTTDGELSCERTNFCAIFVDKSLYIIGGRINQNRASNEIEKFDLKLNKEVPNSTILNLDETDYSKEENDEKYILNYFREDFAVAQLDNKIYIIGGRGGLVLDDDDDEKHLKTSILDSVEVFNVETEISQELICMSTPRVDHMAVSAYGKIYVLGGRSSNSLTSSGLNTVEIFDPKNPNCWTLGKPMNTKRAGGSAFFYDGCIWVVGGNEKTQSIEKFYPNEEGFVNLGRWENVCNLEGYNNQNVDMSNCALIVKSD